MCGGGDMSVTSLEYQRYMKHCDINYYVNNLKINHLNLVRQGHVEKVKV